MDLMPRQLASAAADSSCYQTPKQTLGHASSIALATCTKVTGEGNHASSIAQPFHSPSLAGRSSTKIRVGVHHSHCPSAAWCSGWSSGLSCWKSQGTPMRTLLPLCWPTECAIRPCQKILCSSFFPFFQVSSSSKFPLLLFCCRREDAKGARRLHLHVPRLAAQLEWGDAALHLLQQPSVLIGGVPVGLGAEARAHDLVRAGPNRLHTSPSEARSVCK